MRVIAGSAKGKKLQSPEGDSTRPTADRMKESLFSMIGGKVREASFLDLFAGSGAIGLEALSRGAKDAVFVDQETSRLALSNIASCGFESRGLVMPMDWRPALKRLKAMGRSFDIIFMDPPYRKSLIVPSVFLSLEMGLLKEDGLVAAECASDEMLEIEALLLERKGLEVIKARQYTTTAFLFLVQNC
jgi:16S rRNA (guanine(966)-N(2))-methyltransferase RsmD